MSRLKRLIVETHQRSLWQALAVYAGASLGVLGTVDLFIDYLGLPTWLIWVAFLLLVTGLPVVMVISLAKEEVYGDEVPAEHAEEAAAEDRRLRFLSWRTAGFAFGGVLVVWGLIAGGWVVIGQTGYLLFRGAAADLVEPEDWVTVAEFENKTEEPGTGIALREWVASSLRQSGYVQVANADQTHRALELMRLPDTTHVDEALALRIAERFGDPCIVSGTVAPLGTGYVLTARVIETSTGRLLANPSEMAGNEDELVGAVQRLTYKVRRHLGESLSSIQRSEPLAQVTTSSLEALRKFTQGMRYRGRGDYANAIRLLEEAVATDTAFAIAYRWLDATSTLQGVPRPEALIKAYEHRHRATATDWERWTIEARYYMELGETEKALAVYQTWRDLGPLHPATYINAANLLANQRRYEEAEKLQRQFIDIWPGNYPRYTFENLFAYQFAQGKFGEARATLEQMQELRPEHPRTLRELSRYASYHGDYEAAERYIQTWRENWPADLSHRSQTSQELADLARLRGRAREAERHLRDALAADEEQNEPELYLQRAIDLAEVDLFLRGDADRAVQTVEAALDRYALDSLPPPHRPIVEEDSGDHEHQGLAPFFALAGRPERARTLLTAFETDIDPRFRRRGEAYRHRAWGLVALAEDRAEDAVAELRSADRGMCNICVLPYLGLAYDQAGEPDSAIAIFERYLTTPWMYRVLEDALHRAWILERLGQLCEQRGDSQKAIQYYSQFVELWQDADPELQPRVEAARQRMEQLAAEGSS